MTTTRPSGSEPWRKRLYVPNYQIGEAARYARLSRQTITAWHRYGARRALSAKEHRLALSYLQLIEVAVVASMRGSGISLSEIRETREYASKTWKSDYPFAEHRFKTDGRSLFLDFLEVEGRKGRGTLIRPGRGGQLAWADILGRLKEFHYEREGIVIRWHVAGPESDILIDPRVAFGSPHIDGTPTWVIKSRFDAGESLDEISDDFDLEERQVQEALAFEGIEPDLLRTWVH